MRTNKDWTQKQKLTAYAWTACEIKAEKRFTVMSNTSRWSGAKIHFNISSDLLFKPEDSGDMADVGLPEIIDKIARICAIQ